MTNTIQLTIGKILTIQESSYRVIFVSLDSTVLCLLDTNRLNLRLFSTNKIFRGLEDKSIIMSEEVELIVDEDDLTESELKTFKDKQQIVRRITEVYGPTYIDLYNHQPKPVIDELVAEGHYSRRTINRIILVYLQSGLKDSSLLDQRHWADQRRGKERIYEVQTGRAVEHNFGIAKNAEVTRQFEECLQFYITI